MDAFTPTDRTRVRRLPRRGVYDKALVYAILDEAYVCHVGFTVDAQPYVIPVVYGRHGDTLYIHGSAAARMLRSAAQPLDICVTVTLIDGLVLARSAFHHSVNYRSVVALGSARLLMNREEKIEALRCITNHVVSGRWDQVRPPTEQELTATSVLALPLEEVSAKIRTGPPIDDEEDYALPVWAGVIPVATRLGTPVSDDRLLPEVAATGPGTMAR